QEDRLPALFNNLPDRAERAIDARGVADPALVHRNIEVDAYQHALVRNVNGIEGADGGHMNIPVRRLLQRVATGFALAGRPPDLGRKIVTTPIAGRKPQTLYTKS